MTGRVCPRCAEMNLPDSIACVECGAPLTLTAAEFERFEADLAAIGRRAPSPLDDPEWQQRDNERWLGARDDARELTRTGLDPHVRRLRGAAEATGGETRTSAAQEQGTEEA